MTLSVGDKIAKLGADGQPVAEESHRKFKIMATGSMWGIIGTTREGEDLWGSRQIIEIEVIE